MKIIRVKHGLRVALSVSLLLGAIGIVSPSTSQADVRFKNSCGLVFPEVVMSPTGSAQPYTLEAKFRWDYDSAWVSSTSPGRGLYANSHTAFIGSNAPAAGEKTFNLWFNVFTDGANAGNPRNKSLVIAVGDAGANGTTSKMHYFNNASWRFNTPANPNQFPSPETTTSTSWHTVVAVRNASNQTAVYFNGVPADMVSRGSSGDNINNGLPGGFVSDNTIYKGFRTLNTTDWFIGDNGSQKSYRSFKATIGEALYPANPTIASRITPTNMNTNSSTPNATKMLMTFTGANPYENLADGRAAGTTSIKRDGTIGGASDSCTGANAPLITPPPLTVGFNSQGGTAVSDIETVPAGSIAAPTPPTRTGYSFTGWSKTSTGSNIAFPYTLTESADFTLFAQWSRNSYAVTFEKNADSATGTMAIETRSATTALPTNTFTWDANNLFQGWNTLANGSGTPYAENANYLYLANLTLYAQWGKTIGYSSVGADSGSPSRASQSWTSGAISLPTVGTMVKAGYNFGGWSDGSSTYTTTYTPTVGITLNPVWTPKTYTVSFNRNGGTGSVPVNETWTVGTTPLALPGNLGPISKVGYEFVGWATSAGSTTEETTFSSTSNTLTQTFYAIWERVPYTVTYALNGGTSALPTQGYKYINETFTVASAPTRAGFVFGGWSNGSTIYSAGSGYTVASSDITLTAQWVPTFTVSYILNGSLDTPTANSTVASGTSVLLAAAPTRTGYTFAGWLGNGETTTRAAGSSFIVVEDSTLRASWTPVNYNVTYSLASGTSTLPTESAKNIGNEFAVAATPTRSGYTFTGWSDGINTYGAGALYTVGTAPITLTAQWSAINYTVTYDLGGGVGTLPTKSDVNIGVTFTVSTVTAPTRLAYTFVGWSDGLNSYANSDSYTAGSTNIVLTALWNINGSTQITYANGGGSGTLPIQAGLIEGSEFPLASGNVLTKNGEAFAGWYDGMATYQPGTSYYVGPESSPITLTALWDAGYLVTYQSETGTGTAPVDSLYRLAGATFTLSGVGALTKSGYTFAGWNDGTAMYAAGASYTLASADVTFTAQWNVVAASVVQAPLFIPIKEEKKEEKKEPAKVVVTPKTTAAESALVAKASTATTDAAAIDRLFTPTATQPTPAQSAAGAKLVAIENVRVIDSVTAVNNIALTTTSSTPAVVTISLREPVILDQVTESLRQKVTVVATTAGFTVTPVAGFTGVVVVPIIATVDGVQTVVYNKVVVSPEAPAPQSFAPVTIGRSAIAWSSTPSQVVSYEVAVNNKVVCATTSTTCSVPALIGPNSKVTLVAIGNDATVSTAQVVPYVAKAPIPALKVNFATGSAVLTAAQKAEIAAIAKVIKGEGFTRLVVNGFTDSRGSAVLNAALSKARASAVVAYMQTLLPSVAVKAGAKGSANPVASNTNANGQAANRRTEIATW